MAVRASKLPLVVALASALIALAIAACTLNPQPLPPGVEDPDNAPGLGGDASFTPKDGGGAPGAGDSGNSESDAGRLDAGGGDASADASKDGGGDASDGSADGSLD